MWKLYLSRAISAGDDALFESALTFSKNQVSHYVSQVAHLKDFVSSCVVTAVILCCSHMFDSASTTYRCMHRVSAWR